VSKVCGSGRYRLLPATAGARAALRDGLGDQLVGVLVAAV
jgi:hypothetical protein